MLLLPILLICGVIEQYELAHHHQLHCLQHTCSGHTPLCLIRIVNGQLEGQCHTHHMNMCQDQHHRLTSVDTSCRCDTQACVTTVINNFNAIHQQTSYNAITCLDKTCQYQDICHITMTINVHSHHQIHSRCSPKPAVPHYCENHDSLWNQYGCYCNSSNCALETHKLFTADMQALQNIGDLHCVDRICHHNNNPVCELVKSGHHIHGACHLRVINLCEDPDRNYLHNHHTCRCTSQDCITKALHGAQLTTMHVTHTPSSTTKSPAVTADPPTTKAAEITMMPTNAPTTKDFEVTMMKTDAPATKTPEITVMKTDAPTTKTPDITVMKTDAPTTREPEVTLMLTDAPPTKHPDTTVTNQVFTTKLPVAITDQTFTDMKLTDVPTSTGTDFPTTPDILPIRTTESLLMTKLMTASATPIVTKSEGTTMMAIDIQTTAITNQKQTTAYPSTVAQQNNTNQKLSCNTCGDPNLGIPCTLKEVNEDILKMCAEGQNYCMTDVYRDVTGNIDIFKRCVDQATCDKEWIGLSSSLALCNNYDAAKSPGVDFDCHFCCVGTGCNSNHIPDKASWYIKP